MLRNRMSLILFLFSIVVIAFVSFSCSDRSAFNPTATTLVQHPEWSRSAVIYEVNIRQYSLEGTFTAFEKDIPRLKALGVDILWLMPIHPIGEVNRKGGLGSYYSIKDYKAVNPEFGTMDDFKSLVTTIHEHGMKVIIDWVPNHSSWDNPLTVSNPEFYMKDSLGNYLSPFDWTDVIRFDYSNRAMRDYMTEVMQWWLKETDIDGYRCDVAHMVPVDYWEELRPHLDEVKEVFMLAEADQPELHRSAFNMSYDWKGHHCMNQIAKGEIDATQIAKHFAWIDSVYPGDSYLMQFTSNHDENSWAGTEFERMGPEGALAFAVLAGTIRDMLLIYNGQESAFNRRLLFFEKDSIDWGNHELTPFYKTLISLKKRNQALWNGSTGGKMIFIPNSLDKSIVAFSREASDNKILVLVNLGDEFAEFTIESALIEGTYKEVFTGNEHVFSQKESIELDPWGYLVLERSN
jgi:glycosidase